MTTVRSSGFSWFLATCCLTLAAAFAENHVQAEDYTGWQITRPANSEQHPSVRRYTLGGWSQVQDRDAADETTPSANQPQWLSHRPREESRRPIHRTGFWPFQPLSSSAQPVGQPFPSRGPNPVPSFVDPDLQPYTWQLLPSGLLFKSYMAGEKESRLGTALLAEDGGDTFQDSVLGGRVGLVRYGTPGAIRPEGWQLDVEAAAFLRQNWSQNLDVEAVDFRIGVPLTWRRGPLAVKFGYYHLSSHVGDEFLVRNPGFRRRNFVRDVLLLGTAYNVTPDWLVYGEVGAAVNSDGGSETWEFQFGVEYSPAIRTGFRGAPFFAINAHLREEFDFGGGLNVLGGWQWRSIDSDNLLRIGAQFYTGKSLQYSFFNQNEQLIGVGIWYDF